MDSPPEQRRRLNEAAETAAADALSDVLNVDEAAAGLGTSATDAHSEDMRPASCVVHHPAAEAVH